jgi:hypothetical protein
VDGDIRASDAEREQAVATLRDHLLEGRLTLEEFTERVEAAYRAKVRQDLVAVQCDLPQEAGRVGVGQRRPTRATVALFAHVVRRGRLRLRRRTFAASVFADVDLDLREAQIDADRSDVEVLGFFGNVDVYVPAGVNVEVGGLAVFGHRREWGHDVARPDAPTIRVRAFGLFATIDVWRVPAQAVGEYGAIIRQLRHGDGRSELEAS